MRKFSSFLFAFLLTALMSLSISEIKAIGVEKHISAVAKATPAVFAPLPAPTNLFIFNYSPTTLSVSWKNNAPAGSNFYFQIFRNGVKVGTVDGNVFSFDDKGLTPKSDYVYQIKIINADDGTESISTPTTPARTYGGKPRTPIIVGITNAALSFNSVGLLWNDPFGDYNFMRIEQSTDNVNWVDINKPQSAGVSSYEVLGLNEGTFYYYRIAAVNFLDNGGAAVYSDYAYFLPTVTLKHVPPSTPFGLAATANATDPQTQVNLNWVLGAFGPSFKGTNDPQAVEIQRSAVSGTTGFVTVNGFAPLFGTYVDTKLKPKTKYWYRVRELNPYGTSDFSNVVVITTAGPPIAPSNPTATAAKDALGNSVINLTWGDQSDDEWAYHVERSLGDSLNFKEIAILSPNVQSFVNIPLVEGVTYYYRIRASNTYGFSTYTKAVTATSIVTKAPNAPFFLNAVAATGQVTLTWSDGSNSETKFEVERSTDNVTFAKIAETLTDVVTYVDKSVADATLYYYRVRAVNSLGNSGYATASVTTLKKTSALVVSNDAAVSVFPNPTVNLVKISLPSATNENATIRVIDRYSREVLRKNTTTNSFGEINLDLSNMPEGTYTINIQTETSVVSKRVVKY